MSSTSPHTHAAGIHPTAVVDPSARLGEGVALGPFAVIGADVELGPRTSVGAHTVIEGSARIGADNLISHHVVLGGAPQVREDTRRGALEIGRANIVREFVTVHCGRPDSATRLGDNNYLMAYSHVAHDCLLGSGIELANAAQLGGHVQVDDHVIIGGLAGLHQFVHAGRHSFVGAGSMVAQDVPPFALVSGDRARCYGLNATGLKRHGFTSGERGALAHALKTLLAAPSLAEAVTRLQGEEEVPASVRELLDFTLSSRRGICGPIRGRRRS